MADQCELLSAVLGDGGGRSQATRLGKWLKNRLGQVFEIDGRSVRLEREPGKCAIWTLAECVKRPLKPVVFDLDAPGALGLGANRADIADVGADVGRKRPGASSPARNRGSEDAADVADVFSTQRAKENQDSFSSGATPNGRGEKNKVHPHAGEDGEKRPQRPQQVRHANCEQGFEAPDVCAQRPQQRPQRPQTRPADPAPATVNLEQLTPAEDAPDPISPEGIAALLSLSNRGNDIFAAARCEGHTPQEALAFALASEREELKEASHDRG